LPQGFKKSPTLFGNVLVEELAQWQGNNGHVMLLQYVDDLLIGLSNRSERLEATISLLNLGWLAGHGVSEKKEMERRAEGDDLENGCAHNKEPAERIPGYGWMVSAGDSYFWTDR